MWRRFLAAPFNRVFVVTHSARSEHTNTPLNSSVVINEDLTNNNVSIHEHMAKNDLLEVLARTRIRPLFSSQQLEDGRYVATVKLGQISHQGGPRSSVKEAEKSAAAVGLIAFNEMPANYLGGEDNHLGSCDEVTDASILSTSDTTSTTMDLLIGKNVEEISAKSALLTSLQRLCASRGLSTPEITYSHAVKMVGSDIIYKATLHVVGTTMSFTGEPRPTKKSSEKSAALQAVLHIKQNTASFLWNLKKVAAATTTETASPDDDEDNAKMDLNIFASKHGIPQKQIRYEIPANSLPPFTATCFVCGIPHEGKPRGRKVDAERSSAVAALKQMTLDWEPYSQALLKSRQNKPTTTPPQHQTIPVIKALTTKDIVGHCLKAFDHADSSTYPYNPISKLKSYLQRARLNPQFIFDTRKDDNDEGYITVIHVCDRYFEGKRCRTQHLSERSAAFVAIRGLVVPHTSSHFDLVKRLQSLRIKTSEKIQYQNRKVDGDVGCWVSSCVLLGWRHEGPVRMSVPEAEAAAAKVACDQLHLNGDKFGKILSFREDNERSSSW